MSKINEKHKNIVHHTPSWCSIIVVASWNKPICHHKACILRDCIKQIMTPINSKHPNVAK